MQIQVNESAEHIICGRAFGYLESSPPHPLLLHFFTDYIAGGTGFVLKYMSKKLALKGIV